MDGIDVAVVGAGFGGLATALTLAEQGAEVAVFERLTYPGGCASTFTRKGWQFESGATLFSGLRDDQLFGRWIDRHEMAVEIEWLDPVVEMRTDRFDLEISSDRPTFVDRIAALQGVDPEGARALFARQKRVADALWELFNDPDLLPPFGVGEFFEHVRRSPRYLTLLGLVGSPLERLLEKHGLAEGPVRDYLDAVCQITVQAGVAEAEAPFALAATDYFFRGTGHIHGGIGRLAWAMADAIEELGGTMRFADEVSGLDRDGDGWIVRSRRGDLRADNVVANVLPGVVADMVGDDGETTGLERQDERVREGWGAAMLYLGVARDAEITDSPHHLELVDDSDTPFMEGNHVFCSISGLDEYERSPSGERTVTCSTHVPMAELLEMDEEARGAYIEGIQSRMRRTIERRAPELAESVVFEMTASPRTFERFTGRPDGFVGGIPRRAGLHNYTDIFGGAQLPGLHLVGDSVFPGQSTLACALGGVKVAGRLAGRGARQALP